MAIKPLLCFSIWSLSLYIYCRLGVLETWVLVSRRLETRFYKSWSRSWSWNLRVLVLVLEPSSLGLGLGLGTCDHEDSVFVTHKAWNCPPTTSAPVEQIFSHSGLLMQANRARMGDNMLSQLVYLRATISCKFSCCCTVGISLYSCVTRNTWTLTL